MNRKFFCSELAGGAFTAVCSCLMRHLRAWNGDGLLGILFGSVNSSAWECCKTLLLPTLIWAVLEALALRLSIHRFSVAKTAALYLLGTGYLLLRTAGLGDAAAAAVMLAAAIALSCALYCSALPLQWLFAPSVVLLFLFTALYFSLTPFPPHTPLFRDSDTGLYGIIPTRYDYGASALDAQYLR